LAPVFSISMRFWISVESLNRPPTLLTISSSFISSSIPCSFRKKHPHELAQPRPGASPSASGIPFLKLHSHDLAQPGDRRIEIVINYLIIVFRGMSQFGAGVGHAPLNGRFGLGAALPQSLLVRLQAGSSQKHAYRIGTELADVGGPLHVNIEDDAYP